MAARRHVFFYLYSSFYSIFELSSSLLHTSRSFCQIKPSQVVTIGSVETSKDTALFICPWDLSSVVLLFLS